MADLRILGVTRLSRLTDETTSPERQRQYPHKWAEVHGGTVVHITEDLGVSGAVSPFERPELGPWLTDDPPQEWDVLVAWRLDRIGRNALDTLLLLQWLEQRGKRLVTVADGLDTAGPMAKAFITLAAVFAEMERAVMVERAREGKAALKAAGRWTGGRITYGHKAEDGFLVEDSGRADDVRWMVEKVDKAGWNAARIARELTERGKPAPLGGAWTRTSVRNLLANPALIGIGKVPAPALIDAETFRRVNDKLRGTKPVRPESAELTGVVVCLVCEQVMWHRRHPNKNRTIPYYNCREKGHTLSLQDDEVNELAIVEFVAAYGAESVYEEVVHPDTTAEALARTWAQLEKVSSEYKASGADRVALRQQRAELEDRIDELEARPARPDRVERVATGRTWVEMVDLLTLEELGDELRRRGFRIGLRKISHRPPEIEVKALPPLH